MANFLQVQARDRATNLPIGTPIIFTEMEIRLGMTKTLPYEPIPQVTVEGYTRTYRRNRRSQIDFEAILETAESLAKINLIHAYLSQGRIFDLEILTGLQFYSQPLDALVRDPSESVMTYWELTLYDRNHRMVHNVGLEWRTPCRMSFAEGKRPSVPSAADFVASAPPISPSGG